MSAIETPKAVVTLKIARGHDNQLYVTEMPDEVRRLVAESDNNLIRLTRWRAMTTDEFWTRPDNVVNVEVYR